VIANRPVPVTVRISIWLFRFLPGDQTPRRLSFSPIKPMIAPCVRVRHYGVRTRSLFGCT
jgi:hypothetical protein